MSSDRARGGDDDGRRFGFRERSRPPHGRRKGPRERATRVAARTTESPPSRAPDACIRANGRPPRPERHCTRSLARTEPSPALSSGEAFRGSRACPVNPLGSEGLKKRPPQSRSEPRSRVGDTSSIPPKRALGGLSDRLSSRDFSRSDDARTSAAAPRGSGRAYFRAHALTHSRTHALSYSRTLVL